MLNIGWIISECYLQVTPNHIHSGVRVKDNPEQVGAHKPIHLHFARLYCILIEILICKLQYRTIKQLLYMISHFLYIHLYNNLRQLICQFFLTFLLILNNCHVTLPRNYRKWKNIKVTSQVTTKIYVSALFIFVTGNYKDLGKLT